MGKKNKSEIRRIGDAAKNASQLSEAQIEMESTNPRDNFHTSLIKNNPEYEMIRKYFWGSVGDSDLLLPLLRKTSGYRTKLVS